MTSRSWLRRAILTGAVLLAGGATVLAAAPTTASNRAAARRDVQRVLGLAVLPPGATPLTAEPAGDGGVLRVPFSRPGAFDLVDRHSFWRVSASLGSVVAFVKAHPAAGSRQSGTGWGSGPGIPKNREIEFAFPPIKDRIGTRWLAVLMVSLPGGSTGVRVDAQEVWTVTRSPSEKVPSRVREIRLTSASLGRPPIVALTVTNPVQVRRIISWFDALGVVQPGVLGCPVLGNGPIVTFSFRSASGVQLARASVLDLEGMSGPCNAIDFSIGGHRQAPLVGGEFLKRIQRLLGVRLA